VATPTAEIPLLLSRRSSEELNRWERLRSAAIRAAVLASGTGRKMSTGEHPKEVFVVDGSPECGPTIQMAMTAAKAAGKPESAWLDHVAPAVRNAEQLFKEALKSQGPPAAWLADYPRPTHETRGGPLGDRPQVAVEYLDGATLARAKDLILARLFTSPPTREEDEEDQEENPPDT
jgi:CTP:molybdopterin cytidylyltransferase MocA